ncbi:MAG: tetratricopeptide repeat protein [Fluviicola sp.]
MFTNSKHEKAHEALKKGAVDKAILLYTEALNEAPNDCDILSDRATAFLHKKDQLRCMADFNLAVALDPDYSFRYAARAFAKQNFGDLDGAVADYKKAVDLDPDDAVAQNNLGMLLEQQGYKKEADERFARADKLSKMEDKLYDMMDEMEGQNQPDSELERPQTAVEENKHDDDAIKKEFEARTSKAEQSSGQKAPEDDSKMKAPENVKSAENEAQNDDSSNTSKELKKVFTSRQQFKEFVQFVKNGFKLK